MDWRFNYIKHNKLFSEKNTKFELEKSNEGYKDQMPEAYSKQLWFKKKKK